MQVSSVISSSAFFVGPKATFTPATYCLVRDLGNSTLKRMKRLPYLKVDLWNGRPLSGIVFKSSGLITSPGSFLILILVPSRWVNTKSTPVRASNKLILCSNRRSAPFLLNFLCGYSWTTITTSPASMPGNSSASPWKVN